MIKLKKELDKTGYNVAYHHFKETPKLPFIVYYAGDSMNTGADDRMYHAELLVNVELYTDKKDLVAESKIEEAFGDRYFEKYEDQYVESEQMFKIDYLVRI